ncbi:MAG: anhydro-N-acetylmuramic acid kinase, partial [Candidatus Poribacteria bacterium]|nr:anhydro-N-acetylmuramic acid kinase [Candidatus Poribacteria bacterium]
MKPFHSLSNKESKKIVGLMSGTSVDGVDASLVEIKGKGLETEVDLIAFDTFPFSADIRQRIFELFNPENSSVDKICQMNFLIGKIFAEKAIQVIKSANLKPSDVDLIGSHGQTIYHLPPKEDAKYVPSTLQIGESAVIAYHTKIPVMADFRVADMAAGGQGAPLISYVDFLLFRKPDKTIALQNIGGIANLTLIPANARADQVVAADTGPGNMIIDAVTEIITNGRQQFDRDGQIASQGCIHPQLISKWMDHPFIKEVPPKTTGREDFGQQFAMQTIKDSKENK